jgi:hypothetical protein
VAKAAGVLDSYYVDSISCKCYGQRTSGPFGRRDGSGGTEFAAPVRPFDFRPLSRARMLDSWQCGWSGGDMGRYTYSILPSVSLVPWFRRFDSSRCVVTSMNRMMSNHSCLRSHLGRINIVKNLLCVCSRDYETIDHVMWSCERY